VALLQDGQEVLHRRALVFGRGGPAMAYGLIEPVQQHRQITW
jgi:hypothetical protein